jgi:hypothetical protein
MTGSGKTTTIKALLGYKMGLKKFKGMDWVTIVEKVTDKKVLAMHSNPACKSVTRYIVAVRPQNSVTKEKILLTDTPGLGDTAGVEVQMANILGISRAIRKSRTVIPVIVISSESWGSRGTGIKELSRTISTLFDNYSQHEDSIAVMVNRFTEAQMEELEFKFQSIIDELSPSEKENKNATYFL